MKKRTISILTAIAAALLINAPAYAIQGDLDGSGLVDGDDLAIMSTLFGLDSADPNWKQEADIAGSGLVDGVDLSSFAPNFGMKDGVGSVAANIVWDDEPANKPMFKSIASASKPLFKVANIDTVFINISAADMSPPMSQSFPYSSTQGSISGVSAGTRILTVTGYDGVTPIFKGTKTITVKAGETTYETIYATAIDLTDTVTPKLAGGFGHSLALKSDGTIWAWGLNDVGQFGDSTQASSSVPVDTNQVGTNQTGYIDIDSERYNAIGLRFNGTVSTWGANDCGQLGNDEDVTGYQCPPLSTPINFENSPVWVFEDYYGNRFDNMTAVSAGGRHMAALKKDGTVWTWGFNLYGQLGDNTSGDADKLAPVQVKDSAFNNLTAVIAISLGLDHTLALKSDGTVWACGYNSSGQIGDDTLFDKDVATQVVDNAGTDFLSDIVEVAAGTDHSVALANNSTVWAWGDNEWGQVGGGSVFTNHTALTPVQVVDTGGLGSLSNIKTIAAGGFFTLALAYDGILYAWGRNDYGQLGDGTTIDSTAPKAVNGITGTVLSIFAGDEHALVMTTDGKVWAWGKNVDGQLGYTSSDFCDKGGVLYNCSMTPLQVAPELNLLN